jgi:succinate-semialdehyde dehydrogenase/glutarate-semialdehyde dehydrogenase
MASEDTMNRSKPATGEELGASPSMTANEASEVVERAYRAFADWSATTLEARAALLRRLASLLRERAPTLALLAAKEMGKPTLQGEQEADKCAWVCDYYAEHGAQFLAPEPVTTEASASYVHMEPLGVVLAVMPWNFPYWQFFRFAAPALMAGNAVVLKHASNVPGCARAIVSLIGDAGAPPDLVGAAFVEPSEVKALIEHPRIAAVTFTGSTATGRKVAAAAGAALKKTVLELGGSDPYVVLEDADVVHAAQTCVNSRTINTGQSCIAAKRLIVVSPLKARFEQLVVEGMKNLKVGNPNDPGTQVGPMATVALRDELHRQVQRSIEAGATLLLGGTVPENQGAWYPPTVLSNVAQGMPAYEEELFGPVAAIIEAPDDEAAIEIANDTRFGLGAAVFTSDSARGEAIAKTQLRAGCCFVNEAVRSDPRLPFGGIRDSGYGRELGRLGIQEFVNAKTVYVASASTSTNR